MAVPMAGIGGLVLGGEMMIELSHGIRGYGWHKILQGTKGEYRGVSDSGWFCSRSIHILKA